MSPQELQVQQKRELEKKQEATVPARFFVPTTDIFETEQALSLIVEMPGVDKSKVDVSVEDGVLTIQGQIDFSKYEGMQPVYTEYNIGHYRRSFSLSNKIAQDKIAAEMQDGVLTLVLPKAEEAKPRRISVADLGTVSGWLKEEIRPGDVVRIPAGEMHWHGATATSAMTSYRRSGVGFLQSDASGRAGPSIMLLTDLAL